MSIRVIEQLGTNKKTLEKNTTIMIRNFLGKCKDIFIEGVNKLKGSDKRIALAQTAEIIGTGGQSVVAKEFNVSRDTIRKGTYELKSGIRIVDAFNARGRKKVEEKLPDLLENIKDIVDFQSQTDHDFKTTRLFTRLTVSEIRKQLISVEIVKDDINKINYFVIEHAVNKFKKASKEKEIRNIVAYLKACIYNSIHEMDLDIDSELRYSRLI